MSVTVSIRSCITPKQGRGRKGEVKSGGQTCELNIIGVFFSVLIAVMVKSHVMFPRV